MPMRNVISTLNQDGTEVMGPGVLMYHYPGNDIMNGSLLTVESNHFCVLKSRGAILNVYETGELAEMVYDVDYYVHVDSPQDAVKLVTHMPYAGHMLTVEALNAYAGPVVEQAVNQLVQLTPLEQVNERIHDITELVRGHLQDFLSVYGVMLNDVKVLMRPRDERMRELISLRAFGLSELDAVRYYVAMKMAERGLVSAPNMAVGEPFNIGLTGAPIGPAVLPNGADVLGGGAHAARPGA
jgi:membrane protease subunit (stomatin/prohibitin family)